MTNPKKLAVQPFTVAEIKTKPCDHTFGVAPCTATGEKCYNTRATCKDTDNFLSTSTKSLFLCSKVHNFPKADNLIPCIEKIDEAPTSITGGLGLGNRASVSMIVSDFPHDDRSQDPYFSDRTHDTTQGTFWGKWKARNRYYQGDEVIIKQGILTQPFDINSLNEEQYIIESVSNPDSSRKVKFVLKDILKKIDNKRALVPAQSSGELAAAVNPGDPTIQLKSGQGADYLVNEHIAINKEIMLVSAINADVLDVTRAQWNTPDSQHPIDAKVQICKTYNNVNIVDILYDLFTVGAKIPASFINSTNWDDEKNDWVPNHNLTRCIAKPTGVEELSNQLMELGMLDCWHAKEAQTIELKASSPFRVEPIEITDEDVIGGSVKIEDLPDKRLSRILVWFGLLNPLLKEDDEANVTRGYGNIEEEEESDELYGEIRAKIITSSWLRDSSNDRDHAFSLVSRLLSRFKDTPQRFTFSMFVTSNKLPKTGDVVSMKLKNNQDEFGVPKTTLAQITETTPRRKEGKINYKALVYNSELNAGNLITDVTLSSDEYNYNLWLAVGSPPTPVTINLTVNSGVKICSIESTLGALIIGSFAAGSVINITNEGVIMGAGGDGGDGGVRLTRVHWINGEPQEDEVVFFVQPTNGTPGGHGIQGSTGVTINITNTNGLIASGNGGQAGTFNEYFYNTYNDQPDEPIPPMQAAGGNGGDGCDPGSGGAGYQTSDGFDGQYDELSAGLGFNPGNAINSPDSIVNLIDQGTINGPVVSQ